MSNELIAEIASNEVLEEAFHWLCDRRKDYSPNDDVWILRNRWRTLKPQLQAALKSGTYQLDAVRRIHGREKTLEIWSATDSLVLKAMAIVLTKQLAGELSDRCFLIFNRRYR